MSRSQSVLDALADADTLRIHAEPAPLGDGSFRSLVWGAGETGAMVTRASDDYASAFIALLGARCAFRAVPGLRGEP